MTGIWFSITRFGVRVVRGHQPGMAALAWARVCLGSHVLRVSI